MKVGNSNIDEWIDFLNNQIHPEDDICPWARNLFNEYYRGQEYEADRSIRYVLRSFRDILTKVKTIEKAINE